MAQLKVEHSGGSRRGSGYRIADTEVITAAHVVKDELSVSVVFNAGLPEYWEVSATVRLNNPETDVAVLTIDPPPERRGVEPARFGRLDRKADRLPCRMVGYPRFKLRFDPPTSGDSASGAGPYRDSHQAEGTIPTLSNQREGTLEITVDPPGQDPEPGHSPWEGMSGAAVWCTDLIVGVVSRNYPTDGPNRLAAARIDQWYKRLDATQLIELRDLLDLPDQGDDLDDAIAAEEARRMAVVSPGRRRRGPGILDKKHEDWVAAWFVKPLDWNDTVSRLHRERIVLLDGKAGWGRRSAGVRLLGEHGRRVRSIQQLSPQPDEPGAPRLDPDAVAPDDRMILDLSTADEHELTAIVDELPGFLTKVRDRQAALVVVLPAGAEHSLHHQLGELAVRVGRPDGRKVFEAHLRVLGVQSDGSEPNERLTAVLTRDSMADIAHLARLVAQASGRSASASFIDCLNDGLDAYLDRAQEVASQVAKQPDGGLRAMLLASAMLEGRRSEQVFKAQQLLLQAVRYNNRLVHEFEQPDLRTRFEKIEVAVDDRLGIQFKKLNYAEAVREHFWANFPGLRDNFREWVINCGQQMHFSRGQGEEFVGHYANECLRSNRPDDLTETVQRWATKDPVQTKLASNALESGLAHVRYGSVFRRRCYDWSTQRNLAPPLAYVVIAACVDVIAPDYPNQAVVRLHHLARNRYDGVAETARVALLTLVADRWLFRRLLARLIDPKRCRLHEPRERSLFLAVADARRLTTTTESGRSLIVERVVRRQLVAGWRAVFSAGREPDYADHVWQWLDVHSESRQDELLAVLVEACGAEFAHLAKLLDLGRCWLSGREGTADEATARRTTQCLYSSIDAAPKATAAG